MGGNLGGMECGDAVTALDSSGLSRRSCGARRRKREPSKGLCSIDHVLIRSRAPRSQKSGDSIAALQSAGL